MKSTAKSLSLWNLIFLIPLFLFLALSFISWKRSQEDVWHQRCVEFWQHQQWREIMAMAQNLSQANKPNPEVLYFGMLAAVQNQNLEAAKQFGDSLIEQKILNLEIEKNIRAILTPDSYLSLIRLRRSEITMVILLLLITGSFVVIKKKEILPWISLVAITGVIVLQI